MKSWKKVSLHIRWPKSTSKQLSIIGFLFGFSRGLLTAGGEGKSVGDLGNSRRLTKTKLSWLLYIIGVCPHIFCNLINPCMKNNETAFPMIYGVFLDAVIDRTSHLRLRFFLFLLLLCWRARNCSILTNIFRMKMKSWWTNFKRRSRYWKRCVSELLFKACSEVVSSNTKQFFSEVKLYSVRGRERESAFPMTLVKLKSKPVKCQSQSVLMCLLGQSGRKPITRDLAFKHSPALAPLLSIAHFAWSSWMFCEFSNQITKWVHEL